MPWKFSEFIKQYSTVLVVAFGGALLTLASQFSGLTPPWPEGIVQITAVYQLLVLIVVYQIFDKPHRRQATLAVLLSISIFTLFTFLYLFARYALTFIDSDGSRELKGLECTIAAFRTYGEACPLLDQAAIANAGNIQTDLWTDVGLAASGSILLLLWLIFFTSVAFAIASFVNFQRDQLGFDSNQRG